MLAICFTLGVVIWPHDGWPSSILDSFLVNPDEARYLRHLRKFCGETWALYGAIHILESGGAKASTSGYIWHPLGGFLQCKFLMFWPFGCGSHVCAKIVVVDTRIRLYIGRRIYLNVLVLNLHLREAVEQCEGRDRPYFLLWETMTLSNTFFR